MLDTSAAGRVLIFLGILLIAAGFVATLMDNGLSWFGSLPGDIHIEGENFSVYIPITTMILLSIIINLLLRVITRFL